PAQKKRRSLRTCQKENPDRAWGPVPECGRLKYGLTGKASTRLMVTKITLFRALNGGQSRLGEQDGRLLHLPPCQIQGVELPQANALQWGGKGRSYRCPHGRGGRGEERLCQHGDSCDGARQVCQHRVELGGLVRLLRDLVRRRLLDVAVRGTCQRDELGGALVQPVRVHGPRVGRERAPGRGLERRVVVLRV